MFTVVLNLGKKVLTKLMRKISDILICHEHFCETKYKTYHHFKK